MGREYPLGFSFFRERLRRVFQKNVTVQDPERISGLIKQGNYVIKELEVSIDYSRLSLVRTRLIRTVFYSPSKHFQYLTHRLIRIPDKANKFRRSPGVRINGSILYALLEVFN